MKINEYEQVWDIWLKSQDMLYKYNLSRFKDPELAKDVVQETLLKMYNSCCSDRDIVNVKSWMLQISHNAALDKLAKNKKQREMLIEDSSKSENDIWTSLLPFLEPLINLLPEKYGTALKLADINGIPQKEIAEELGLNLSATKSRIQRARQMLKAEIMSCYTLEVDKNGVPIQAELRADCTPLQKIIENK